jgi:hypothetical protein
LLIPLQNRNRGPSNPTNTDKAMSGSAAPKLTNDQQTFEPDFKAKEVTETDNTWFEKRFGTKKDDQTVAGSRGKASKSGGSGQHHPKKKTRVHTHLFI